MEATADPACLTAAIPPTSPADRGADTIAAVPADRLRPAL